MTVQDHPVRMAVLRDFPVRLWLRSQEHNEELLREFALLLIGERSGELRSAAPGQIVALADRVNREFGPLLTAVQEERQRALRQGLDRVDSHIPLVEGAPALLDEVHDVLASADEFCRSADLLTLPRPRDVVRLFHWTRHELVVQYAGGEPTPWPGPF